MGIDLCVTELLSLNEAEGNFEVKFNLQLTWYDGALKTKEWDSQLEEADGGAVLVTSYCAPRVRIKDVLEGDSGWEDHNHVAEECRLVSPGVVTKNITFRSTIRDDNPIHDVSCIACMLLCSLYDFGVRVVDTGGRAECRTFMCTRAPNTLTFMDFAMVHTSSSCSRMACPHGAVTHTLV